VSGAAVWKLGSARKAAGARPLCGSPDFASSVEEEDLQDFEAKTLGKGISSSRLFRYGDRRYVDGTCDWAILPFDVMNAYLCSDALML
jgi:hypothetical protein